MGVRELTFFDRDENRWSDDVLGVMVSQVEAAGWAGLGGIRSGDLIQRIGSHEVKDIEGFRKAMKAITKAQHERVVFVVLRDQRTSFQYVEPDWKPTSADETSKGKDKPNLTKVKE
jgi:S1-C subfamily serine protease